MLRRQPAQAFRVPGRYYGATSSLFMAVGFAVAFALAAIVLVILHNGDRYGTALRATARWSFALFWLAYAGGAVSSLFGGYFTALGRYGRELGLAFASAQLVHTALVIGLYFIASGPLGAMLFFWAGIFCTYILALISLPWFHAALGSRLWRICSTMAMEYIALVFACDFVLLPLQANGVGKYPLSYVPFAVMLFGGQGLRALASARHVILPKMSP
jgi:hypothetical protein